MTSSKQPRSQSDDGTWATETTIFSTPFPEDEPGNRLVSVVKRRPGTVALLAVALLACLLAVVLFAI
jgi:hypothetical protein